jgi:hypothetical protein
MKSVVAVSSSNANAKYVARRESCLKTWLPLLDASKFEWLFVIGDPVNTNGKRYVYDAQTKTLFTNCTDAYHTLSSKTITLFEWFLNETDATHLWKVDDDSYVNCQVFNSYDEYRGQDYVGCLLYLSEERTPDKVPVFFMGGAGYCVSRAAASKVVQSDLKPTETFAEDYVVGKILAKEFPELIGGHHKQIYVSSGSEYIPDLMIGHRVESSEMEAVHEVYSNNIAKT